MFNQNKLKIALLKENKSFIDIAKILNINIATLYRKMNGSSDFYRGEIQQICEYLNITDLKEREDIFFGD